MPRPEVTATPSAPSSVYRWAEFLILFVLAPLIAWADPFRIRLFGYFLPVLGYVLWQLRRHPVPVQEKAPAWNPTVMLVRFAVSALLLMIGVLALMPERFFYLPQAHPSLALAILVFYPLFSALPQEIIYRRFFFSRYAPLFGSSRLLMAVNILAFALLHIAYGWIAMILSALAGYFFANTYRESRQFFWVWIEHTLYGLAVFYIGIGHHFYKP